MTPLRHAALLLTRTQRLREETMALVDWSQAQRELRVLCTETNDTFQALRALRFDDDADGSVKEAMGEAREARRSARELRDENCRSPVTSYFVRN